MLFVVTNQMVFLWRADWKIKIILTGINAYDTNINDFPGPLSLKEMLFFVSIIFFYEALFERKHERLFIMYTLVTGSKFVTLPQ
jgi:hypothetical protein